WGPWTTAGDQNGRVEVIRFEARQADPEVQRLAAAGGDAVMAALTRAGIDTVSTLGAPGDGRSRSDAELRVTGSVSRDDDGLAINTQIIERESGVVLLSNRFVRQGAPVGLIEQAALGIASPLSCLLEDRKRAGRRLDSQVLSLYLNTCDAVSREGNAQRMLESARRLIAAAPDLAVVHAVFAIAQGNAARNLRGEGPEAEALRRGARASADRAIRMDAKNSKAYIAMAQSYPAGGYWLERERNLQKAREADPNLGPGRMSYIEVLREVGRLRDAMAIADQLLTSTDARTSTFSLIPAAFLSAQTGDMGNARSHLDQLDRLNPELARGVRWTVLQAWEEPAAAVAQLDEMGPRGISPTAFVCTRRYLQELPGRIAARARGLPAGCERIPPDRRIRMLARQGDLDGAYAEFAKLSVAERSFPGFIFYPEMKAFRSDPRFIALVRELGLVDYWSKSGHWPDFCAEPGLPYDCRALARS
ncbi:hypothetical protein, partial [Phenylobacterium sp.]|uniref:hypothetical protein n=1 Tax=Phenylobacterium sp. TaxID=1871053 RepID=UPI0039832B97